MKTILCALPVVLAGSAMLVPVAEAQTHFTATLSGESEVPPVVSEGTGGGVFMLNAENTELSFIIGVSGLSGPIAAAHFHNAPAGTPGGIVRGLSTAFTDGVAIGSWKSDDAEPLTPQLVEELLAGNIYVNVHTTANQGGEVRGQVLPGGTVDFGAELSGDQETPPVATDASGGGVFSLNAAGTELSFIIGVSGLSGPIAAAHFHNAPAGTPGGIVRGLSTAFTDGVAMGSWKQDDAEPLTPQLVGELLAGNIYVNVHTAAHQSGEARGQLLAGQTVDFGAELSGDQETPPVATGASGGGVFSLNAAGTELSFIIGISGLSGPIAAAHFHNAPAGTPGGIVRGLSTAFTDGVAMGSWKQDDAEPLTPQLVGELLAGNIYVNVHTAAHQSGEARGQLLAGQTVDFTATLSGGQEVPAVDTPATGEGTFSLNAAGTELAFEVTVADLSGPIMAAHFHNAPRGVNGPVVRGIAQDFTGNTATGIWKSTDAEPLTPELVGQLLAGNIYTNAHTMNHEGGEIRGQLAVEVDRSFIRADANGDGNVDISDPILTLGFLFRGSASPPCLAAADSNDDGEVNLSDVAYTINWALRGGPAPPPPFPACGTDPTPDSLGCEGAVNCGEPSA